MLKVLGGVQSRIFVKVPKLHYLQKHIVSFFVSFMQK